MPELPEVESVRRTLEPLVVGRRFTHVVFDWPGCDVQINGHPLDQSLPGARCTGVGRRGKYLLLHLDGDRTLVVHLRMTGRLVVVESGTPTPPHHRAWLAMDDGRAISFADQRKFGRLALAPDTASLEHLLRRVGPEPFGQEPDPDHRFGGATLMKALMGRTASVKAILLDQRVVAGLGNIYVDEALFLARVHPATPGGLVGHEAARRMVEAIVVVLNEAIEDGGTTLADYRDARGERGSHQDRLRVFRRQGKPCLRCGTTIEKSVVAQRGTHVCPTCQPR